MATVTVTVGGVNDAPEPQVPGSLNPPADDQDYIPAQSGNDSETLTPFDVSVWFNDPDGEVNFFSAPNLPSWMEINPFTGVITGTPPADASQGGPGSDGTYPITIIATDPDGESFSTVVTYTIANPAPTALDDMEVTDEDTVLSDNIFADNGAGADFDIDGDDLIVSEVNGTPIASGSVITLPSGALLTMNADGSYDYNPNRSFEGLAVGETGNDSFTYTIDDGEGGTAQATVNITVEGVNDAPIPVDPSRPTGPLDPSDPVDPSDPRVPPVNPQDYIPAQTGEDGVVQAPLDLTPYFGDPDGSDDLVLTVTPSDLPDGLVFDGTSITGTPTADASQGGVGGVYDIPVTATDPSGETFTTIVRYTITNPPPVAGDDVIGGDEDTIVNFNVFEANAATADIDPDGDVIVVSRVATGSDEAALAGLTDGSGVGSAVAGTDGGLFTVNADGTTAFDPNGDFEDLAAGETRTTQIVYQIDDGQGGTDTASVTYTVTGVNDAPIPVDPTQPNGPLNPGDPVDPDNPRVPPVDPQDYIPAQTGDDAGPVTPLDLTPYFGDPDGTDVLTLSVDPADLPAGLTFDGTTISGTLSSDASQFGTGGGTDGVYEIPVTATDPSGAEFTTIVTYTISNPAPVAVNDVYSTLEDTALSVNLITGSDSDPDGDALSIDAVALPDGTVIELGVPTQTEQGLLTVNTDGSVDFVPALNVTGQLVFGYTLTDGQGGTDVATVTIDVTPVNDAPIPVDPIRPVVPTDPTDPNFPDYPTDPEDPRNQPLDPDNYIPVQTGQDSDPVTPLDLTPYFGDPDPMEPLTITVDETALPPGVTFDPLTNTLSGTPAPDASQLGNDGTYEVEVTATDSDGESVTTTLTYVITNPAPAAVTDGVLDVVEDTPTTLNVLGNDSDPDGDDLTVTQINGTPITVGTPIDLPSGASLTVNPNGSVTYTPVDDYNGPDSFTYTIDDGQGGTDTATVTLNVTAVNDAPVVTPAAPGEPALPPRDNLDGDSVSVDASGPFSDIDGDDLTFSATGLPDGLLIDPVTGVISGTLPPGTSANGPFNVVITATDSGGLSASTDFVWTVENIPPATTGLPDVQTQDSTAVNISTAAGFGDLDGDVLTYSAAGLPPGLSIDPDTGVISGTPGSSASVDGPYSVVVTVTDAEGASAQSAFTLDVQNPAPVIAPMPPVTVVAGEPTVINVGANTADPDGDTDLTFSAPDLPPGLTLDPRTGIITGQPEVPQDTPYVFTVFVDDGEGGVTPVEISLQVNEDGYVAPALADAGPSALPEPYVPLGRDYARLTTLETLFADEAYKPLREILNIEDREYWGGMEAIALPEYGDCAFIGIEAVAYDHAVYVSLRETLSAVCGVKVASWDVDYARSGGSLPAWIDHAKGSDKVVLNRTVADETAVLHIRALLDNGRSVSMAVEVDMATGTVEQAGQSYARAATLSEQFEIAEASETAEHKALLMALAG